MKAPIVFNKKAAISINMLLNCVFLCLKALYFCFCLYSIAPVMSD